MQSATHPRLTFPATRTDTVLRKIALSVAASGLVAVCAHISVSLPFTPVPITMQTFAVLLLGMLLGPGAGFGAMSLYLAEGMVGLPVFSPHGMGGVAQLLGPTGGFLVSYPIAAAMAGTSVRYFRRVCPPTVAAAAAGLIGSVPVFLLGAGWVALVLHLSFANAWRMAMLPFASGEGVKLVAVATAYALLHRTRRS